MLGVFSMLPQLKLRRSATLATPTPSIHRCRSCGNLQALEDDFSCSKCNVCACAICTNQDTAIRKRSLRLLDDKTSKEAILQEIQQLENVIDKLSGLEPLKQKLGQLAIGARKNINSFHYLKKKAVSLEALLKPGSEPNIKALSDGYDEALYLTEKFQVLNRNMRSIFEATPLSQSRSDVNRSQGCNLSCFRHDQLAAVFAYLSVRDRHRLQRVCKKWYKVIQSMNPWKDSAILDTAKIKSCLGLDDSQDSVDICCKTILATVRQSSTPCLNHLILNLWQRMPTGGETLLETLAGEGCHLSTIEVQSSAHQDRQEVIEHFVKPLPLFSSSLVTLMLNVAGGFYHDVADDTRQYEKVTVESLQSLTKLENLYTSGYELINRGDYRKLFDSLPNINRLGIGSHSNVPYQISTFSSLQLLTVLCFRFWPTEFDEHPLTWYRLLKNNCPNLIALGIYFVTHFNRIMDADLSLIVQNWPNISRLCFFAPPFTKQEIIEAVESRPNSAPWLTVALCNARRVDHNDLPALDKLSLHCYGTPGWCWNPRIGEIPREWRKCVKDFFFGKGIFQRK